MNTHQWEIKEISNAEMNTFASSDNTNTFTHGITIYRDLIVYLNEETKSKRVTLLHELTHVFMYEFGHNQTEKEYGYEDVCEIVACCHDIIHKIIEDYFK